MIPIDKHLYKGCNQQENQLRIIFWVNFHHGLTVLLNPGIMVNNGKSSPNGRKIQVNVKYIEILQFTQHQWRLQSQQQDRNSDHFRYNFVLFGDYSVWFDLVLGLPFTIRVLRYTDGRNEYLDKQVTTYLSFHLGLLNPISMRSSTSNYEGWNQKESLLKGFETAPSSLNYFLGHKCFSCLWCNWNHLETFTGLAQQRFHTISISDRAILQSVAQIEARYRHFPMGYILRFQCWMRRISTESNHLMDI